MTKHRFMPFSAAGMGAVVASLALVAAPAMADTNTILIQEGNLVALDGATIGDHGGASHSFQPDGLHVTISDVGTTADPSFEGQRWLNGDGGLLSKVRLVDYDWTGTDARPGIAYDVDADGDGTVDCELVGEQKDGGEYVWLNKGQDDFPGSDYNENSDSDEGWPGFPICEASAPENSDDVQTETGHHYDGTLDEWAEHFNDHTCYDDFEDYASESARTASFDEGLCDNATVLYVGVVASGVKQDGVLSDVHVGQNHFIFGSPGASTPRAASGSSVADVTGHFSAKQHAHRVTVTLTSDATPSGFTAGNNLVWTYTVTGRAPGTVSQTAGRTDQFTVTNQHHINRAGNHIFVTLYKNGVQVGVFVVVPRPHHRHHHSG